MAPKKKKMTFEEAIEDLRRRGHKVTVNDPSKRRGTGEIIASPRQQFREWYGARQQNQSDDED